MILLTACNNINMKNMIKFAKSVESLDAKLLYQLNVLWFLLIWTYYLMFIMIYRNDWLKLRFNWFNRAKETNMK